MFVCVIFARAHLTRVKCDSVCNTRWGCVVAGTIILRVLPLNEWHAYIVAMLLARAVL